MREIKFMAWHKEKKILREVFEISFSGGYVILAGFGSFGEIEAPIRDVELMQCTGLKDQNGVEIYEGDIIKFKGLVAGSATRQEYKTAVIEFVVSRGSYTAGNNTFGSMLSKKCEIIGNIYQNPELLKDNQ